MNDEDLPSTLQQAITYFADADRALEFMMSVRWPEGGVSCIWCASVGNATFLAKRRVWKCRDCRKQFSIKSGTIFEDSPLKLETWLPAVWVIVNAKNGVSSCELARSLNVTQKTAWFMLQRIRLALQSGKGLLKGTVEVDETYIGGKARNMHKKVKERRGMIGKSTGQWHLQPVQGLLERTSKNKPSRVILKHVEKNTKQHLDPTVRQYVLKGSTVNTDALKSYQDLGDDYTHKVIDHAEAYVNGQVHTNGMENFWSLLKRTIKGTYVSVEPFHLFRYLDEQAFRFNERKDEHGDKGRFITAMFGVFGRRLTWKRLTGQDGVPDSLPATV